MMLVAILALLSCSVAVALHTPRDQVESTVHIPTAYRIAQAPVSTGLTTYTDGEQIELSGSSSIVTLDYGTEVEGWPYIEVAAVSSPTIIELKYTEQFKGLDNPNGDGPWTFSNGLSNTWRTERFNVTIPGRYESTLLQGGLRWQSISLLAESSLNITAVGLRPTISIKDVASLPGFFECSNSIYNDLWSLGARTVQAACFDAGSQPSTWEVTDQGALIHGQQPAQSLAGVTFANYTMTFETKVVTGGTGWRVAAAANGYGPYFVITASDYPTQSMSSTSFPANTLLFGYGWSIINQTTLTSGPVQQFPLPFSFDPGTWHTIVTHITDEGYMVAIDETQIASISYDEASAYVDLSFTPGEVYSGTWGFGPFQDQTAYFKNVQVNAANGSTLYTNTMTTVDILDEFSVNTNSHSVCVDGSKRDRLVWMGDFAHTARTILSTTNRSDFITGSLDFAFSFQLHSGPGAGLIPVSAYMGASPRYKDALYPASFLLTDYDMFALKTIGDYYRLTGDTQTLSELWPQIKRLTTLMISKIDPTTGLVAGLPTDIYFISGFQQNATAVTGLLSHALQALVPLAESFDDPDSAGLYSTTSRNLNAAINKHLWSDSLGTYSISLSDHGNFSLSATAFAILSNTANTTQATLSIIALEELFLEIGYKDNSATSSSNTTQLSPNIQGFLLESLFHAHVHLNVSSEVVVPVIKNLLDVFWPHMLSFSSSSLGNNEFYTGTTWEYLYPSGSPGIDLFTSLSHPWSSAPTYILSEYILGLRPLQPGFATWTCDPVLVKELGITYAKGKVPTPKGGIEIEWEITFDNTNTNNGGGGGAEKEGMRIKVKSPNGTYGTCAGKGMYMVMEEEYDE